MQTLTVYRSYWREEKYDVSRFCRRIRFPRGELSRHTTRFGREQLRSLITRISLSNPHLRLWKHFVAIPEQKKREKKYDSEKKIQIMYSKEDTVQRLIPRGMMRFRLFHLLVEALLI